jgi:subtilisin-like proprotein convertase family protein
VLAASVEHGAVDGLAGTVTDVNLHIDGFSHERPDDVDIMLVSPTGKKSVLLSDIAAGGTAVSDIDLVLDEEAPQDLPLSGGLQSTSYRPRNYYDGASDTFPAPVPTGTANAGLSAFDGIDPTGVWSLFVYDDQFDYFGAIADWSLELTTTGPTPYPSTITVAGLPTSVTDVDVTLTGLDHINLGEVDMLLVGPGGQQATIFSDAFGSGPEASIGLDDEAAMTYRTPKWPGTFQPTNEGSTPDVFPAPAPTATGSAQLSVFDGTDPNGEWRLFVVDDTDGVRGSLGGWSLRISTADAPAPGTPTTDPAPTPTGGGTADTRHLRVSATNPGTGATGVRRGADVVATLDEAVRRATVTGASAYLVRKGTTRHVPAGVTWQSTTKRIVIDPSRRLRAGTTYRAVITTAVKDLAGNRLDQEPTKAGLQRKTWRFTTR